ncbi:hypothetical protein QYE76_069158 [Lolium multiflorum]|uniref:Uncharacterized protein n=1 Tax=Lolium multiflorum TaxID=4521 RepID=A0AAD8SGV2_LOLMU|nr:hypothetical protein QYE76_069158 [Lolium multiflorum]
MIQLLQTLMEDRETDRAERQASLASLQQLANNQHGHGNHDHPGSKLKNFQNTNPPVFSKTEEPLDVDDWLQTMENNLEVAGVDENEKVCLYALSRRTSKSLVDQHPCHERGQMMTWADFKLKFSKYHVPPATSTALRREPPTTTTTTTPTTPRTGSNAIPVATKDKATITMNVEWWDTTPMSAPKGWPSLPATPPAQQQRRVSTGKKFAPNNPNNRGGRLYHMNAEEAHEAQDVVMDRDIEFIIELIPGTGPIAQRAYSMNSAELVELKKQLDDMLFKDSELKQVMRRKLTTPCIPFTRRNQDVPRLKEQFWWHGMKREIGSYIAKCDIVNESRQNTNGRQDCATLTDSEWKWDVGMDFITGLPKSRRK